MKSADKNDPLATSSTAGALIAPMFSCIDDAASLLNTATPMVSIPDKFEALSNIGHVKMILKLAKG